MSKVRVNAFVWALTVGLAWTTADEAPAVVCLYTYLFPSSSWISWIEAGSSDAIDSASSWPDKTVGKATTMGDTAPWSFDDGPAWTKVDCLKFFFPFLFSFGGVELLGFAA